MSGRDPDAILAELGATLQGAWSQAPRRRVRGGRRGLLAAAAATLALVVPTAIATRETVFARSAARLAERAAAGRSDRARCGRDT
ncbi:MAG TPA: hypothetical protein VNT55_12535, partial [Baekduia sp.]|nr:hypothetical protein [Baekduia sp.]